MAPLLFFQFSPSGWRRRSPVLHTLLRHGRSPSEQRFAMFKNMIVYRIAESWQGDLQQLEEAL
ncbi:hypothetical protein WKI45_07165, partial [Delftia tsuruhatensis]